MPVFFVKLVLFIIQIDLPALYKCIGDNTGSHIQYISLANNNVSVFTFSIEPVC